MTVLGKVFEWLCPYDCLLCGREGELLCDWCRPAAIQPLPGRCFKCQQLTDDSRVCVACRSGTPLARVWVMTQYEGVIRQLLHKYKFERAKDCSLLLSRLLNNTLPSLPDELIISFVPTATSRVRARGYDHAELLAKGLAEQRGVSVQRLLRRHGQSRQVGTNRQTRQRQLERAFAVRRSANIVGRRILLIDDVLTTGATLKAAALALKAAGAKSIWAAVLAQKL